MNCRLRRSIGRRERCGSPVDDEEMAEVRRKYELYRSVGLACEVLDGECACRGRAESFGGRSRALCGCWEMA